MIKTKTLNNNNKPSPKEKEEIIDFLYTNLQEYGDEKKQIQKAINYSLQEFTSFGGFVMLLLDNEKIVGATVVNQTGMGGYIPENILVYIATHKNYRGQGLGKQLMQQAIETAEGDIALHVEENNPAIHLYKKLGFTNPYLEMRLKK